MFEYEGSGEQEQRAFHRRDGQENAEGEQGYRESWLFLYFQRSGPRHRSRWPRSPTTVHCLFKGASVRSAKPGIEIGQRSRPVGRARRERLSGDQQGQGFSASRAGSAPDQPPAAEFGKLPTVSTSGLPAASHSAPRVKRLRWPGGYHSDIAGLAEGDGVRHLAEVFYLRLCRALRPWAGAGVFTSSSLPAMGIRAGEFQDQRRLR